MSDKLAHREIAETVSSSSTFFYKFVFTTIWSSGFGLGSRTDRSSRRYRPL